MSISYITIKYKSFKPKYPPVITEDDYIRYKIIGIPKVPKLSTEFSKEFLNEIVWISLALIFVLADINNWFVRGGIIEFLEVVFFILGLYSLLSLLLSSASFFPSRLKTEIYFKRLTKRIKESNSYTDFCKSMCDVDKNYLT